MVHQMAQEGTQWPSVIILGPHWRKVKLKGPIVLISSSSSVLLSVVSYWMLAAKMKITTGT